MRGSFKMIFQDGLPRWSDTEFSARVALHEHGCVLKDTRDTRIEEPGKRLWQDNRGPRALTGNASLLIGPNHGANIRVSLHGSLIDHARLVKGCRC